MNPHLDDLLSQTLAGQRAGERDVRSWLCSDSPQSALVRRTPDDIAHFWDNVPLAPMAEILLDICSGRPVLVLDDAERENEADLICAADALTEAGMAMMIREGSGIVCLSMPPHLAKKLGLSPMVETNGSRFATAFTQSIEASFGVSTGVSAADRTQTVRCALRSAQGVREIVSPGHVFPLIARARGVLERRGHTEASMDLAMMAGRAPMGVLCELMNPDGSMARGDQVREFAARHGLRCTSVAEIVRARSRIATPRLRCEEA